VITKGCGRKSPFSSNLLLGGTEENHQKLSVMVRIPVHWVIIWPSDHPNEETKAHPGCRADDDDDDDHPSYKVRVLPT
jgi:hypothetical protein